MSSKYLTKNNGSTRHGAPVDYDGSDPFLCNASTQSGRPCRAPGLAGGRCKLHLDMEAPPAMKDGVVIKRSKALRRQQRFQQFVQRTLDRLDVGR